MKDLTKWQIKQVFILGIVFFILCAVFLPITKLCKTNGKQTTDTVYIYKEIPVYKDNYIPVEKTRYIPNFDTIVIKDTIEIVRDYYTAKTYIDTLKDSLFNVVVFDSIAKNTIIARRWNGTIKQKQEIVTKTIYNDKRVFAVGPGIYYNNKAITPVIQLQSYKNNIGYNIAFGSKIVGAGVVFCF